MATFVNNSDSIYTYSESLQKVLAMDTPIEHRVKKGEYLGRIANQYHTTIGRIKNWNNLSSNNLRIGQKLVIYVNLTLHLIFKQPLNVILKEKLFILLNQAIHYGI